MGCGTGTTALIHAPFVKHITGIDISPNMLEIAHFLVWQSLMIASVALLWIVWISFLPPTPGARSPCI